MTSWLVVAGDVTPVGGMDAANHGLARYLARDRDVHLVTHRASPDLEAMQHVSVHGVRRPFGRHALGGPFLARAGRRLAKRLKRLGVHSIVNGGNCRVSGAVNWVHYVHAAYTAAPGASILRSARSAMTHRRDLANERTGFADAGLVICNSRRTRDDIVHHHSVDGARTRVIYYGCDPLRLTHVCADERAQSRARLGWLPERPVVAFVGALGDRRKAFDTVFGAWMRLCADSSWDADLVVIGTGAERSLWERKARQTGTGHRMRFLGFRDDVPELLAAADVLVHPARYEAYGLSVREALCRGIPAIVSRSAGVAEEYPPWLNDLLLEDPDDAAELTGRLQRWRRQCAMFSGAIVPVADTLRRRTWDHMSAEIVAAVEDTQAVR
jgi:glycosyltransferase involved in cell wall biosynthesis